MTNVLIVEDDPLIAISLRMVLEDEGHEVCGVAATEQQAISLGLTYCPDIAVVDVRLAEGSGIEAGRRLLARVRGWYSRPPMRLRWPVSFPIWRCPSSRSPTMLNCSSGQLDRLLSDGPCGMPIGILVTGRRRAA